MNMETMDKGIDQGRIFSCLFLKLEAIEEKLENIQSTLDGHGEILNNLDKSWENSAPFQQPQEPIPQYSATPHTESSFVPPSTEYNQQIYTPAENPPHSSDQSKRPQNIIKIQHPKTLEQIYMFDSNTSNSEGGSNAAGKDISYQFAPITKQSSQGGSNNMKPNEIQLSLSLYEDVELKETEKTWKPTKLSKTVSDKSTEEKKTEDLLNKIRSILNKLTPQKLNTLVDQIKGLPIDNPYRLTKVIDLIITKAIDEPNFSEVYARMCKILCTGQFVNINDKENNDKNQTDFRRALLNSCQKQFEHREISELEYKEKIARELKECTHPDKLKELKARHQEEERKIRMKAVGMCRFIGELFKLDMIKTNILYHCITYLIKKTEEEPLESLCKLLTTVGKHYESKQESKQQRLGPIMDELARLASKNKKRKNAPQVSSRIRFMIQDVLDLRANNWVPRHDDNTPNTLIQIQKVAEQEFKTSDIQYQLNKDFVTPACLEKFIDFFIEYFIEKRKDKEVIAPVLGNISDVHNNFTPQLLVERFNYLISLADDLIIDYPKLLDYMAMIMGYTLASEHFNFDHVWQSCKPILRSESCKKVLTRIFDVINSIKSPEWISCKWNSSSVTLDDFLAEGDVDEFIETYNCL